MVKKIKQYSELTLSNLDTIIDHEIPSSTLKAIGHAFKSFTTDDLLEIGSTILKEDLNPLFNKLKLKKIIKRKGLTFGHYISSLGQTTKKEGFKKLLSEIKLDSLDFFKKTKKETQKEITKNYHETTILIPETKKRLTEFIQNISRDYSLLQSDEERGKYILKLTAYASVFIVAFHATPSFFGLNEKKSFFRKLLLPILLMNGGLTLINRILEQVEKKIAHHPEALEVIMEVRKFIKIVNEGIGSGMTLQAIADGLTQSNLSTKGKIDTLVHSTILALFSKDVPETSEQ